MCASECYPPHTALRASHVLILADDDELLGMSSYPTAMARQPIHRSAWKVNSTKLLALAHPPGLRCCRFPTHPERLNDRSHAPNEHDNRQD
jgi:hypothetical protein